MVGIVLSVRQLECLISIWVEEEGEAVKSGALRYVILRMMLLEDAGTQEIRREKDAAQC